MTELFQPTAQLKISLTSDCNNDCVICLNKTTRSRNGQNKGLSPDKIKELIDEASALGMVGAYWTGGEPLIEYESLLRLMEYSSKKGLISSIVTNGGLIGAYGNYRKLNQELLQKAGLFKLSTTEIVKSLKNAGLTRIYFSVDNNHTTLEGADTEVHKSVPTEVISQSIGTFLDEGFGRVHALEAIGYQLRMTATSSGVWLNPTKEIIQDVINKLGVKLEKELSTQEIVYANEKGKILLKLLGVSNIGDAEGLDDSMLESKAGKDIFHIKCSHFIPTEQAYDKGKYHRDLFVDYNGIVYTCGNHAYPVGNVYRESLASIIKGINMPTLDNEFGMSRKVFHSLLLLSENKNIGNNAIGEAFRLMYAENPKLIESLKTQCGGCNSLGSQKDIQTAFLKAFETIYKKR
ncbi:radical SAM protein [Alkaliphilus peptidifermentans]|uniref:Iron-sulfur cluster-binding domain-containing protein n=1 Tax=Alkaliphilus peptidifermentans DSM 18978 TaxID=1120976 RepID=A0A1G5IWU2_9FIRM|nr:radical SAM protein [Alkaliphilus peptidifermentans]SCY79888.1 Iron-sulfur cluster-binding domain-containing protein [Alkaliphilus peptidifermentans DSM 18978]